MRLFPALLAMSLLVGSCSYAVPDIATVPPNPTFNNDILPLFMDHCLVCHGFPSNRGAPTYFRLDVYLPQNGVTGAKGMGGSAVADVATIKKMPPAVKDGDGVGPNGIQMLLNWQTNQFPE